MALLNRSYEILVEQGGKSFISKATRYAMEKVWRKISALTAVVYWWYRYGLSPKYGTIPARDIEYPVFNDLFSNIEQDDVFYDVGAYKGLYTIPVGNLSNSTNIVAFEPSDSIDELKFNLDAAGLSKIKLINKGISSQSTEYYKQHDKNLVGTGAVRSSDETKIPIITGDEILEDEDIPLPDIIKIDVAGAELDVIKGLEPVLKKSQCRLIYCEIHLPIKDQEYLDGNKDSFYSHLEDWSFSGVVKILYQCGFSIQPIMLRNTDIIIKAYK